MTPIIEAHGITKRYGKVEALAGLELVAESGRVTALLGPNGAGKTTFVNSVATLVRPDAGELRVAGIDVFGEPKKVRQVIGLAGQFASVEPAMTGRENLNFVADGVDVLLTTQYLEEADQLARDVVIVDHGRVIDAGTPDELKDRSGRDVIEVRPRSAGDLPVVEEVLASVGCERPQTDI